MRGLYATLFGERYPLPWQMSDAERIILIGILTHLKPSVSIEIGTAQGGSLQVLSAHSGTVYSLDTDSTVPERLSQFPNVDFRIGLAKDTLPVLLAELHQSRTPYPFVLIDGDHATESVRADVNALLSFPPLCQTFVLFHDSFNPDCRKGIETADWDACPYAWMLQLDFIHGQFHRPDHPELPRQMWSGLALAMLAPEPRSKPFVRLEAHREVFHQMHRMSAHWQE